MKLTFRNRLFIIFGITLFTFCFNTSSSLWVTSRVEGKLGTIQRLYLPKLILGPKLTKIFEAVVRGFQDSVSASDRDILAQSEVLKIDFLKELSSDGNAIAVDLKKAILDAFEDYYDLAHSVSLRLLNKETGQGILDAASSMQIKQAKVSSLLKSTFAYDTQSLSDSFLSVNDTQRQASQVTLIVGIFTLLLLLFFSLAVSRTMIQSLNELATGFQRFGRGDFERPIVVQSYDEVGETATLANEMARSLKELSQESERSNWIRGGQVGLAKGLEGKTKLEDIANQSIHFLARYLDAAMAVFYIKEGDVLKLVGHYAVPTSNLSNKLKDQFELREGLLGQMALDEEMTVMNEVPENYWMIRSALGEVLPKTLLFLPIRHQGQSNGIIELAFLKPVSESQRDLLKILSETLSIRITTAEAHRRTEQLLLETQTQAKKLEAQEGELRSVNTELLNQQQELQQSNEELEEQRASLEAEKDKLESLMAELEALRREAVARAKEAQDANKFKSEFLANMSHELRTPLNAIMVLSQLTAENRTGNLSQLQVDNAKSIYSSGKDLLSLIDDILDLSKVEAGKLEFFPTKCMVSDFVTRLNDLFLPQATIKKLKFTVEVADDTPPSLTTDFKRIEQILRNLVSNAIKFTERGHVKVCFYPLRQDAQVPMSSGLEPYLGISVQDTGIGIPADKQEIIFQEFVQLDSSIGRKYQGTGLGLAISLNLVRKLGGGIKVESRLGQGSTFMIYLPETAPDSISHSGSESGSTQNSLIRTPQENLQNRSHAAPFKTESERQKEEWSEKVAVNIFEGKRVVIADDDIRNIYALRQVILPTGAEVLVANNGREAVEILEKEQKIDLILMDIMMPEMSGIEAIQIIRKNPRYQKLPIIAITAKAMKKDREECLEAGASDYLAKPVNMDELISLLKIWLTNIR